MNRALIVAAWLLGLAAIAWSCSSRQGTTRAGASRGPDVAVQVQVEVEIGGAEVGGSA